MPKKHTKPPVNKEKRRTLIQVLKSFFTCYLSNKNIEKRSNHDSFEDTIDEIKTTADLLSEEEKHIFNNFLLFGQKTLIKVMIPRSDLCAVPVTCSLSEISKIVVENGHARTLVYEDTLDNILGFVHIKDLFNTIVQKKEYNLKKLVRKPIVSAPSMKLVDLLAEMQKMKTHIAIILDEYGGTDGIVTIEDIMEEIVGQIDDEHDAEDEVIEHFKIINPSTILCNARVHVDEIEKLLGVKLKKHDEYYETVGGLVLARAGHFPKAGSTIIIEDNILVEVVESTARSIKTLKFVKK